MTEINMNNFKEPTSLMAGTNIIFSVGSFMYLYKRMEQLQKENDDMKKDLKAIAAKIQVYNNNDVQTEEALVMIKDRVKKLDKTVKKVDELRIEDELKAIKSALNDSEISVKSPKLKHKNKKYKSSESSSTEEEIKKKPTKKPTKEESSLDEVIDMLKKRKGGN